MSNNNASDVLAHAIVNAHIKALTTTAIQLPPKVIVHMTPDFFERLVAEASIRSAFYDTPPHQHIFMGHPIYVHDDVEEDFAIFIQLTPIRGDET